MNIHINEYRFNYIITIHNKESLIADVLNNIIAVCGKNSYIYPVLDGCTDRTESIVDQIAKETNVPITKIFASDVHEILSLNIGLSKASQQGKGFNILLQDDVILEETNFEKNIINVYEHLGYDKVGVLAFRHGVDLRLNKRKKEIEETNLIESWYGTGMGETPLYPGFLVKRMVGVRSPECISFEVVKRIGVFDEKLAPYTYDNHDYSLRCLIAGMDNYVFSIKYKSDVKWGGMRQNPHPRVREVMERNRKYLFVKHYSFLDQYKKLVLRHSSKQFRIDGVICKDTVKPKDVSILNKIFRKAGLILHSFKLKRK